MAIQTYKKLKANCLKIVEIFQLASSNLHKRYMAREASLIVILT